MHGCGTGVNLGEVHEGSLSWNVETVGMVWVVWAAAAAAVRGGGWGHDHLKRQHEGIEQVLGLGPLRLQALWVQRNQETPSADIGVSVPLGPRPRAWTGTGRASGRASGRGKLRRRVPYLEGCLGLCKLRSHLFSQRKRK